MASDWAPAHARLAHAEIEGDVVTVHDIRNNRYRGVGDYDSAYETRSYRLSQMRRMWLIIEPYSLVPGIAHAFVSFEFADGSYLTISPELRRRRGEQSPLLRSLFAAGELIYVVASEEDAIKLRTNYRMDDVYVYPLAASREFVQRFFLGMLEHANRLGKRPEPFHILTNNCAINLLHEANAVEPGLLDTRFYTLFPGHVDRLLAARGLLALHLPLRELRRTCYVSRLAREAGEAADFSARIRTRIRPLLGAETRD